MRRLVRSLLLVLFLAFQAGTLLSVMSNCCPDETAAECATDHCGEDCAACTCALDRPLIEMPSLVLTAPSAPARAHAPRCEAVPPEVRPFEILHVPRIALA